MNLFLKSKFLSVLTKSYLETARRCISRRTKNKRQENPYLIVRARKEDHCCIVDLMWQHYYASEPTTVALGLGSSHNPVFDNDVCKDLAEGLTLIARCKYTGDIVGGCINKTACQWDPDLSEQYACTLSCPKIRQLYQFYAYVQRFPCLWERYEANKIFELSQLFVRRADRGRGVAALLVQASRKLGADCGFRVVRLDATNHYSSRICDKLKMHMICEIPYCSYTGHGPTFAPVFNPPAPHTSCKVYIDVPVYE